MKQTNKRFKSKISQGLAAMLLLGQVFSLPLASDGWGAYTAYAAEAGPVESIAAKPMATDAAPPAETGQAGTAAGQAASAAAEPMAADAPPPSEAAPSGEGATPAFADIADSYAREEIAALAADGILSGTAPGLFAPRQPMTRAELAKIVSLASGLPESREEAARFADVPAGSWYSGYVGALVKSGITEGTSDAAFSPDQQVTREQLVVFFMRAMGLQSVADSVYGEPAFTDWDKVSDWAKPAVRLAARITFVQGIDNGDGTVSFNPGAPSERQALARLAYEFHRNRQPYLAKAGLLIQPDAGPPKEEPKPATGGGGGGFGGGGGGGVIAQPPSPPSAPSINQAGTINGDFTITASGTFGPADGAGTAKLTGTLYINPGSAGEVTLQNVEAPSIVVQSGSSQSIRVRKIRVDKVTISAPNQTGSVRLLALEGTQIKQTDVQSKAILENQSTGSAGQVTVGAQAAGEAIELRGVFSERIIVNAPNATLRVANPTDGTTTSIGSLEMAANGTIETQANTTLATLYVSASQSSITIAGSGTIAQAEPTETAQQTSFSITGGARLNKLTLRGTVSLECPPDTAQGIEVQTSGDATDVQFNASDALKQAMAEAQNNRIVAAIAALAPVTAYSPDAEQATLAIRRMIGGAQQLGSVTIQETDMQKLIATETALNAAALEEAKAGLQPVLQAGDQLSQITGKLTWPAAALWDTSVAWSIPSGAAVNTGGEVTRPPFGSPNAEVTVSAQLTRKGVTVTKTFNLTILALPEVVYTSKAVVTDIVYSHAAWIRGGSEPGAQLTLTDSAGALVAQTQADPYGSFLAPLRRSLAGNEKLSLVASASGKEPSAVTDIVVTEAVASKSVTALPTLEEGYLYTNTPYLSLSSPESSVYEIKDGLGNLLAVQFSESKPVPVTSWSRTLQAGDTVRIVAKANGKQPSGEIVRTILAADYSQTEKPELHGKIFESADAIAELLMENGAGLAITKNGQAIEASFVSRIFMDHGHQLITLRLGVVDAGDSVEFTAVKTGKTASSALTTIAATNEGQSEAPLVAVKADGSINTLIKADSNLFIRRNDGKLLRSNYSSYFAGDYVNFTDIITAYDGVAIGDSVFVSSQERGKHETTVAVTVRNYVYSYYEGGGGGSVSVGGGECIPVPDSNAAQTSKPAITSSAFFPRGGKIFLDPHSNLSNQIIIRTANGKLIATSQNWAYGTSIEFTINEADRLIPGDSVFISARAPGERESEPVLAIVQPYSGSMVHTVPSIDWEDDGVRVEGSTAITNSDGTITSIDGSFIIKNKATGAVLITGISGYDGRYYVKFTSAMLVKFGPVTELQITSNRFNAKEGSASVELPARQKTPAPQITSAEIYQNGGKVRLNYDQLTALYLKDEAGNVASSWTYVYSKDSDVAIPNFIPAHGKLYLVAQQSGFAPSDPVELTPILPVSQERSSAPVIQTPPDETGSDTFSWSAEPFARLTLTDSEGRFVGLGGASNQGIGSYPYFVHGVKAGDTLSLIAETPGKRPSAPVNVTVTSGQKTEQPLVQQPITEMSSTLKIGTVGYTYDQFVVVVKDSNGAVLGWASKYDNYLSLELLAPLHAGQQITILAKEARKNWSDPLVFTVSAAEITATPTVGSAVYDLPNQSIDVSIAPETEGQIKVKKADGSMLYSAYHYSSTWPKVFLNDVSLTAGEALQITATAPNKKESAVTTVIVQEAARTATPSVTGSVYDETTTITGFAESGASVSVRLADGTSLGSSYSSYNGSYSVYLSNGIRMSETIYVYASVTGKKESLPLTVSVVPAPLSGMPTVTTSVYTISNMISGYAEAGAAIFVKRADGTQITQGSANSYYGDFNVYFYDPIPALTVGETLYVSAKALNKKEGPAMAVVVKAAPTIPLTVVTNAVYEDGGYIKGTTLSNAQITVKSADFGSTLASGYAYSNEFEFVLNSPPDPGSHVNVQAVLPNAGTSLIVPLIVQPISGQTPPPTVSGSVYANRYVTLYVQTLPYAKIIIKKADGTSVYSQTTDKWGRYTCYFYSSYTAGEQLILTVDAPGKTVSEQYTTTVLP